MSVWYYIRTDKHELSHLEEVWKYFSKNVQTKNKELDYAEGFRKYGLPGWRMEILRRTMGLEDALTSLAEVELAISEHPDNTGIISGTVFFNIQEGNLITT